MRRIILLVGIILGIAGTAYSVLGMMQLASYSAGPNYPSALASHHFKLWLVGMGLSLALGIWCLRLLLRIQRNSKDK